MATSVTFDPNTGVLSNVPDWFSDSLPAGLRWTIAGHAVIKPGDPIGVWLWDDGTRTPIVAPPNCRGVLIDVNDRVSVNLLDMLPPQPLIELAA